MDIHQLAQEVFTTNPKGENSIQVEFNCIEDASILFEALLELFTEGMKILFSKNNTTVDLQSLSHDDFTTVKKYFKSFGVSLYYHVFHMQQVSKILNKTILIQNKLSTKELEIGFPENPVPELLINYKQVNSTKLIDYKFQLQVNDILYVIYFEL